MKKSLLRKKRKNELWFKYIMSVSHLWLGLLSSIVIFTVCLSGSIYAFKNQIEGLVNRQFMNVHSSSTLRVNIDSILFQFEHKYGAATSVQIPTGSNESLSISSFNKGNKGVTIFYDPYTGKELGQKNESLEMFFAWILNLHRFLLLDDVGKFINGTAVLIFVYMLFSGFVLWLPEKFKKLGSRLFVRWKSRFYRLNYDLHSILGFYSYLLLFFIALTGLYVSFTWVKNAAIIGLGGDSIIISESNLALKTSLSNAFNEVLKDLSNEQANTNNATWTLSGISSQSDSVFQYSSTTTIQLPNENFKTATVTRLRNDNTLNFYVPDRIEFSNHGHINKVSHFYSLPLHEQFKLIAKPLHTGEIMGLPSIILYFLVSLIGCSLPVTGFIIWWKKS